MEVITKQDSRSIGLCQKIRHHPGGFKKKKKRDSPAPTDRKSAICGTRTHDQHTQSKEQVSVPWHASDSLLGTRFLFEQRATGVRRRRCQRYTQPNRALTGGVRRRRDRRTLLGHDRRLRADRGPTHAAATGNHRREPKDPSGSDQGWQIRKRTKLKKLLHRGLGS